jgi:hypothetical protein
MLSFDEFDFDESVIPTSHQRQQAEGTKYCPGFRFGNGRNGHESGLRAAVGSRPVDVIVANLPNPTGLRELRTFGKIAEST